MKKLFALATVAVALMVGTANAQLSVNAGYLQQTLTSTLTVGSTTSTSTAEMPGAFVGVMMNKTIKGGLGVAIGVDAEYCFKNDHSELVGQTMDVNTTQLSIAVPVLLNYTFPLGNALVLKAYVGPAIGYGLSYETKTTLTILGNATETTADGYAEGNGFGRLNIAGMAGVGVDFNSFGINVGYSYGLNDLFPDNDNLKGSYQRLFVGLNYNL